MIERRSEIADITVAEGDHVQIRFALIEKEGDKEISRRWHRACVAPGADLDKVLGAVNADIGSRPALKMPAVAKDARLAELRSIVAKAHTPDVVARHAAAVKASLAELQWRPDSETAKAAEKR